MNIPSVDNHFVLFADGRTFNLLDVLIYEGTISDTVLKLKKEHGDILKATDSPLKIFNLILGLRKDNSQFVQIGETNWKNLWMIRHDFEYYLAYVFINNERILTATSDHGMFWNFIVVDA